MARKIRLLLPISGLAAGLVTAISADQASAQAGEQNAITDVQVGERGDLTRIAVICRTPCQIAPRAGGEFFIPGVKSSMRIDLSGRSRNIDTLVIEPTADGSLVAMLAGARPGRAAVRDCRIEDQMAACVDFEFTQTDEGVRPAPSLAPPQPLSRAKVQTAAVKPAAEERLERSPVEAGASAAKPNLREAGVIASPEKEARLAPPERLSAPISPTFIAASPTDAPAGRRPILRTGEFDLIALTPSIIAVGARDILGKRLKGSDCRASKAALAKDAWALDAMIDVGYCQAAAGRLEEADGVFKRLLAFSPDNYEALVGRALIAKEAGEKSIARKYFQDALNAQPPDQKIDRIIEAMNRL